MSSWLENIEVMISPGLHMLHAFDLFFGVATWLASCPTKLGNRYISAALGHSRSSGPSRSLIAEMPHELHITA